MIANCCLFPWLEAKEAHHLSYKNLGHEWIWRDVVPLSKTAHTIVHWGIFWNSRKPKHKPRILMNAYLRFVGFPLAIVFKLASLVFRTIF